MTKTIDKATIIRTVLLFLALLNQILVSMGYSPLPIDDAQAEMVLSTLFTIITAIIAWWKNNDITRQARRDAAMLEREKQLQNK